MFSNQSQAELRGAIRRLLVLMAMGDGTIHPSEVRILQKIYLHATGEELSESDLLDEISEIQMHGADLESYLVSLTPSLGDEGRRDLVRAGILLGAADGKLGEA